MRTLLKLVATHDQADSLLEPGVWPSTDRWDASDSVGQQIGAYKLLHKLGEGGMPPNTSKTDLCRNPDFKFMNPETTRHALALLLGAMFIATGFSQDGAMHGEPQPPLEKADFRVFAPDDSIGLFLLVGQSNMKGRGSINMKPETDERILFIHPTQEAWFVAAIRFTRPGHQICWIGGTTPARAPDSASRKASREGTRCGNRLDPRRSRRAPMNLYNEGKKLYMRSLEMTRMGMDQAGGERAARSGRFCGFRVSPIR